jgi:hypothetical protein
VGKTLPDQRGAASHVSDDTRLGVRGGQVDRELTIGMELGVWARVDLARLRGLRCSQKLRVRVLLPFSVRRSV